MHTKATQSCCANERCRCYSSYGRCDVRYHTPLDRLSKIGYSTTKRMPQSNDTFSNRSRQTVPTHSFPAPLLQTSRALKNGPGGAVSYTLQTLWHFHRHTTQRPITLCCSMLKKISICCMCISGMVAAGRCSTSRSPTSARVDPALPYYRTRPHTNNLAVKKLT